MSIIRTAGLLMSYIVCFWSVRLIVLTIITSLYVQSIDALHKVDAILRTNLIFTYGISAVIFLALLQILQPIVKTRPKDILNLRGLSPHSIESYVPIAYGILLGTAFVLGTALGGGLQYLGFHIKLDEAVFSITAMFVLVLCFFLLFLVEEFLLRQCLERTIRLKIDAPFLPVVISSVIYVLVKKLQFDCNYIEALNFLILNFILHRLSFERNFIASAAFAGAFFSLIHLFFGMPLLGHDMPGIFLMRTPSTDTWMAWMSGESRGPESGLICTTLFLIFAFGRKLFEKIRSGIVFNYDKRL